MEKLLLTIKDVCEVTSLGKSTVYGLLDKPGGFQAVRISTKEDSRRPAVRVKASVLRQWIEAQSS